MRDNPELYGTGSNRERKQRAAEEHNALYEKRKREAEQRRRREAVRGVYVGDNRVVRHYTAISMALAANPGVVLIDKGDLS